MERAFSFFCRSSLRLRDMYLGYVSRLQTRYFGDTYRRYMSL
jgi:hypothetical protein